MDGWDSTLPDRWGVAQSVTLGYSQAVSQVQIGAFCRKWKVRDLALFGSVLTEEFRPDSDVDVMVVMADDAPLESRDYRECSAARDAMRAELRELFAGRKIDLIRKKNITNPFIRYHALTHKLVLYAV